MLVKIKCTSSIFIFPNFRCLVTSNEKCTLGKKSLQPAEKYVFYIFPLKIEHF